MAWKLLYERIICSHLISFYNLQWNLDNRLLRAFKKSLSDDDLSEMIHSGGVGLGVGMRARAVPDVIIFFSGLARELSYPLGNEN